MDPSSGTGAGRGIQGDPVRLADMDGDGDGDYVAVRADGSARAWLNNRTDPAGPARIDSGGDPA